MHRHRSMGPLPMHLHRSEHVHACTHVHVQKGKSCAKYDSKMQTGEKGGCAETEEFTRTVV